MVEEYLVAWLGSEWGGAMHPVKQAAGVQWIVFRRLVKEEELKRSIVEVCQCSQGQVWRRFDGY